MRPTTRRRLLPFALPLALLSVGCLENEEEIVVHPDGSIDVTMRSEGDFGDLLEGYAVPLHGPWVPVDEATEAWIRDVGPDTGSPSTRERARSLPDREQRDRADLRVRAHFASVSDWPRFTAPPHEPYRDAYLERGASLRTERRGAFTVYTFERTYRGRDRDELGVFDNIVRELYRLPTDVLAKIDAEASMSRGELEALTEVVRAAFRSTFSRFAREALMHENHEGPQLPDDLGEEPGSWAAIGRIVTDAEASVAGLVGVERVGAIWDLVVDEKRRAEQGESGADEAIQQLELDAGAALRRALEDGCLREGLPEPLRNTVLARLEWQFTSFDQTSDLGDEKFSIEVTMPGLVVSGNYDSLSGNTGSWRFEDEELSERDITMTIVSIVE